MQRELDRQALVLRPIDRDQLREADGGQQAGPESRGECAANMSQHRQSGPERIAAGGAGVVWRGIEEEARGAISRQVVLESQYAAEHEPLGCYAESGGPATEVAFHRGRAGEKEQHAARHRGQNSHPAGEGLGGDLPARVEAAEHEALRRQAELGAGEGPVRDHALRVIRLIARQIGDLFRVVRPRLRRYDDRVGDQIVHEVAAHAAEIADVTHLHWSRAQREDVRPCVTGVAAEVDGDVYLEPPGERGDLVVGLPSDRQKTVERRLDPRTQRVTHVGTQRECR